MRYIIYQIKIIKIKKMAHQKQFREKELAKSLKSVYEQNKKKQFQLDNLPQMEKLEYDIARLQNTIINTNFDIKKFGSNSIMLSKIKNAQIQIEINKKLLEELKNKKEVLNESINN
jgi:hypothetical protein